MIPWWVGLLMFTMGVGLGFALGIVPTLQRRSRRVVRRTLDVPESRIKDMELRHR